MQDASFDLSFCSQQGLDKDFLVLRLSPSAVIFDFDGVVVDSLGVHIEAWKISFQALYSQDLTDTTGLPGRSTAAIAEILSARVGQPATANKLADLKRETLKESRLKIELLPGAKEAFDDLSARGIPFGIASNAPKTFIKTTLERLGIHVDHLFGSDDVLNPKPEPDVFFKCAKSLNISVLNHPKIIVFEDSPHGLRAAVKAGMFPIGVLTQNTSEQMLSAGARVVCHDLRHAIENGWLEHLPS
jgi:HAD superfamily hydrolase (TIGR01549 family)